MTTSSNDPRRAVPPVVVAVDGSPTGRDVLGSAAEFAAGTSAPVIAVHIRTRPSMMEYIAITSVANGAECALHWRDELERDAWLDCISVLGPTALHWQFVLRHGDIATTVRQLSDQTGAAAVFAGTRIRTHLHHCPARALARTPGCPIHLVEHS